MILVINVCASLVEKAAKVVSSLNKTKWLCLLNCLLSDTDILGNSIGGITGAASVVAPITVIRSALR